AGREGAAGLEERNRLGSLLGRGGFGIIWTAMRLSDKHPGLGEGFPSTGRHQPPDSIVVLLQPYGTSAPLEMMLLDKVSTGSPGVVQRLEWLELPNNIVMVLEHL
ncbi:PIM1 kinase, partial [Cercotrichas coryphoeus]|nr:PIM1 kinase [Cercotrichas coryphoeus]